jgi:hypothetical protein
MIGKLKDGEYRVGHNRHFVVPHKGQEVNITDTEDHFIWGKRYKIEGYDEWFEENCFEYVEE